MSKFIDEIRQKSDQHKNKIIWISMLITVCILIIIWIIVGNGKKTSGPGAFFQSFSKDLQDSKSTFSSNLNLNVNQ